MTKQKSNSLKPRPKLSDIVDLVQVVRPRAKWSDLVLPAAQTKLLQRIVAQTKAGATAHPGASVLFAGDDDTGKTLAAEVVAGALGLQLCRSNLAAVVSKYIGETEKNLRRLFDAAEAGGAILFFDEADALFGKRSEVKDSHDRYANIEVNYLLQRMEDYRGLAVLATNMTAALDSAFMRRLRFVVDFPFPDAGQRREIWRKVFPPPAAVDSLDLGRLVRVEIAGSKIPNIAVNAAFLAAGEGQPIGMEHVMRAARRE